MDDSCKNKFCAAGELLISIMKMMEINNVNVALPCLRNVYEMVLKAIILEDNQDVIFIFGIDKNAVSLALMNKYNNETNKAESFLDKIFPISFNMPNWAINISFFLKANFDGLEDSKISVIEEFLTEINFINPINMLLKTLKMMKY